jgi:hypothetical protein
MISVMDYDKRGAPIPPMPQIPKPSSADQGGQGIREEQEIKDLAGGAILQAGIRSHKEIFGGLREWRGNKNEMQIM